MIFIVSFLAVLIITNEYKWWAPRLARLLVWAASRVQARRHRARYEAEWGAELDALQREGGTTGLLWALLLAVASPLVRTRRGLSARHGRGRTILRVLAPANSVLLAVSGTAMLATSIGSLIGGNSMRGGLLIAVWLGSGAFLVLMTRWALRKRGRGDNFGNVLRLHFGLEPRRIGGPSPDTEGD